MFNDTKTAATGRLPVRVSKARRTCPARGVAVLETVLVLPLLFIILLAVVEFGVLLANLGCVEMASRAGADAATGIPLPTSGPVPAEVLDAVNRTLSDSGITLGAVTLEHNVDPGPTPTPPYTLYSGTVPCIPAPSVPAAPALGSYVRVTVCVETTQLAPNLLMTLGLDITGWVSQQTTTRCY